VGTVMEPLRSWRGFDGNKHMGMARSKEMERMVMASCMLHREPLREVLRTFWGLG